MGRLGRRHITSTKLVSYEELTALVEWRRGTIRRFNEMSDMPLACRVLKLTRPYMNTDRQAKAYRTSFANSQCPQAPPTLLTQTQKCASKSKAHHPGLVSCS